MDIKQTVEERIHRISAELSTMCAFDDSPVRGGSGSYIDLDKRLQDWVMLAREMGMANVIAGAE